MVATRRRAFARAGLVGALLALVVSPGDAPAAELAVFSAGAMEPGLRRLIPAFERETGQAVRLTIAVPNVLRHRVEAGEVE